MEWCKQFCQSDGVFLDIGAHSGTYTVALAPYCQKVYSFEPQQWTFYALCGSVVLSGLKNVTCLQTALGSPDQVGEQVLHIVSEDGGGSTLVKTSTEKVLQKEVVKVVTLDSLGLQDICFIKMDVEDNEASVLEGSKKTLVSNNFPTILFESNSEDHLAGVRVVLAELAYQVINIRGTRNMYLAHHGK
jgi:FkbM family methyltransferase